MNIRKAVDDNLKEAVDFLCESIRFKSIAGSGEREVQEFIRDKFAATGDVLTPEVPESLKGDPEYTFSEKDLDYSSRKNIVLEYPSTGDGPSLILNSHSDVVPADTWEDAFKPVVREGSVWGRGASDAKGQVATIYLVLLTLKRLGIRLKGRLSAQVVIEEEIGGNGALALIRQGYNADAAIILESTRLKVCPANRGAVWFRLDVEGKSVHMARIREGINAIEKTCCLMKLMKEYEKRLVAESRDVPLFEKFEQPVQVNFGSIRGGNWPATVCGDTTLEGGVGFLPNKNINMIKKELDDVIKNCGDEWIKAHYSLTFDRLHNDAYSTPADHPVVESMAESIKESGLNPEIEGFLASCDARLFNKAGNMPTVVFGPGDIADAHSEVEHMPVSEMKTAAEILTRNVLKWCGRG